MSVKLGEPRVHDIVAFAADAFDVTVDDLLGHSRRRPLVGYRQATIAACRHVTSLSYPALAEEFDRDHTTLIHACRVADPALVGRLVAAFMAHRDEGGQ